MECPDLRTLQAYDQGGLGTEGSQAVHDHLLHCRTCSATVKELRRIGPFDNGGLRTKETLADRLGFLLFEPSRRMVWIAIVIILVAIVALEPMRTAADDLLGVFRVQRVAVVKVDPAIVQNLPTSRDLGTLSGTPPTISKVSSVAEAARLAGFVVRIPAKLPIGQIGPAKITVSSRGQLVYTFDEARLRTYLSSLGMASVKLPPADQLKVKVDIPAGVAITYAQGDKRLTLVQGPSPTMELPPGLDVGGLREQLLTTLPAELAGQLRSIPDWQSTAILPVPQDADVRTVKVDGVEGTLVGKDGWFALIWQRNGILYGLHGNLSEKELLEVANSLVGN